MNFIQRKSWFFFVGIVLCNLLNYLAPGIIKYTDVSFRPQKSRVNKKTKN